MNLSGFDGNEKLIQRLSATINNGTLSHAYIFEGEAALDKLAFAKAFVKAVLCKEHRGEDCDVCAVCRKIDHDNYEDLMLVQADGASIKDEAIEKLQERLKVKPYGERNIAVISNADTMTLRAQNRLLKTLEEPAAGTVIILLSENIENLTNTILSRCVKFRLNYYGRESYEGMLDKALEVADLLMRGAPFYQRKEAIAEIAKDNDKTVAFLDALEKVYRDYLIIPSEEGRLYKKSQIYRNVTLIEETRRQLLKGVSKSYALKDLMIKIGG
jgi:DNA polymerase III delta prime subunit